MRFQVRRLVSVGILGGAVVTVACTDRAKADYDRCVTPQALPDAVAACAAAVGADPNSPSGKAAAVKLAEYQPRLDAWLASQKVPLAGAAPAGGTGTESQAGGGGQVTADALRDHADAIFVPYEWQKRIAAAIIGDKVETACPALKFVGGSDEFEQKQRQESAVASCTSDNVRAVTFAKSCGLTTSIEVLLSDYNFDAKKFTIEAKSHGPNDIVLVTKRGAAYVPEGPWLLTWPGPHVRSHGEGLPSGGCVGPLGDAIPALAAFTLDLPMPEADARALRERVQAGKLKDKDVEVVFLATGTATEEDIVCGMGTPRAAVGTAVGWRLRGVPDAGGPSVPLTDWNAVTSWQPAPSCAHDKVVFGLDENSLGKAATIVKTQCPPGDTATAGLATECGCGYGNPPAPRPPGICEQYPKSKGRDCLWRCQAGGGDQ